MKGIYKLLFVILLFFITISVNSQENLYAYYKVTTSGTLEDVKTKLETQIKDRGLIYLGGYNTQGKTDQYVVTFTNDKIIPIALAENTLSVIASIMKFGIKEEGSTITVSLLNPEYIFYAYFRNTIDSYTKLKAISDEVHEILKSMGSGYSGFGGQLSKNALKKYHYMIGMPYFDDSIMLNEHLSFEGACTTIENNLKKNKGNTSKVYRLKFPNYFFAVYGVSLKDQEDGEANFLPIIGDKHIAAMPYEIVVIGKKVVMLDAKYRLALHWPELTMGQFMEIVSTPGYIKETMTELTK